MILLSTAPNNSIFSLNIHYNDQVNGGLDVFDPAESSVLRVQGLFPNVDHQEIELLTPIVVLLSTPPNNSIFSLNIHYKNYIGSGLYVFDPAESSILRAQGQFPNVDR